MAIILLENILTLILAILFDPHASLTHCRSLSGAFRSLTGPSTGIRSERLPTLVPNERLFPCCSVPYYDPPRPPHAHGPHGKGPPCCLCVNWLGDRVCCYVCDPERGPLKPQTLKRPPFLQQETLRTV